MPLKISDLESTYSCPTLPASLPVFALSAPPSRRRAAIGRLGEQLKLGTLRPVELDHGVVTGERTGGHPVLPRERRRVGARRDGGHGQQNELREWQGLSRRGPMGSGWR